MRRWALALGASSCLIAGCAGSFGAGGQTAPPMPRGLNAAAARSVSDSSARKKDLLYVSSVYNCDVFVFTYPRGTFVQTINTCSLGFGPAFGLCSDAAGDVFMTMGAGFSIFEFAHGGSAPIAQLESDSLLPVGCSVNPKTGDLGVASQTGNVAIYKNASGTPQIYSLPNVQAFYFCTFDDRGNLFADGEQNDRDRTFALAELPHGASALHGVAVPSGFTAGLALQWDGRHIAIGQMQGSNTFIVDRIRVSHSAAKIVGSTTLTATPNSYTPFQFWIQGGTIIQPEAANAEIGFWKYPRGGDAIGSISVGGNTIVGATVSVAPPRR